MIRIIVASLFLLASMVTKGIENEPKLNVLIIGAHPDDCEIGAGGLAALYLKKGHNVKFLSMTNGSKGHQSYTESELIKIRKQETLKVAEEFGLAYDVLDNEDAELEVTMKNRLTLIKKIREWNADIVITHRPNTYHPDHRYTSDLVNDASFLIRVPKIVPNVPALNKTPVFLYMSDTFKKPNAFQPDIVIDITKVIDDKLQMLHAHKSQFYEWLPWLNGTLDEIPDTDEQRKIWLKNWRFPKTKHPFSTEIVKGLNRVYGETRDLNMIEYIESYELCEYGRQPSMDELKRMLPL